MIHMHTYDRLFGPHTLASFVECQLPKWRTIATLTAGSRRQADQFIAEFLEELIDLADRESTDIILRKITDLFLCRIKDRYAGHVARDLKRGKWGSQVTNYENFEANVRHFLTV